MAKKTITEELSKMWNDWENKYVPDSGMASTVAGEIIRAFQRIEYRWYNDGDKPYVGYGNETCNGSDRYLHKMVPGYITPSGSNKTYYRSLELRQITIIEYLASHLELFTTPNSTDSRTRTAEDCHYGY